MKKNTILDKIRKRTGNDVKREVDLSMDIAARIHEILVKKGKNQKDLAKSLGKHESEVCKWLSGTHNFTFQTIARIEVALGENIVEVSGKRNKVSNTIVLKMDRFASGQTQRGFLPEDHGIIDISSEYVSC